MMQAKRMAGPEPVPENPSKDAMRVLYLESLQLVERLHRRLLDVIKDEFDRAGRSDINAIQALLLFNIGESELTAGELRTRGYYLGSNVSYNLKKLVELEFIAQALQMVHAPAHPAVLDTNTLGALAKLAAIGVLDALQAETLKQAGHLYHRLPQVLRLCVDGPYDPSKSLPALNQMVAAAAACPDIPTAESLLADNQLAVAAIFDRIIGNPA